MSIRKLFAILIAVAVLFAPAFTSAGMASSAMPDHHAQMMDQGHCDPVEEMDDTANMACCGPVCMAVAVTPAAATLTKPLLQSVPVAGSYAFPAGIPQELATPPPRTA